METKTIRLGGIRLVLEPSTENSAATMLVVSPGKETIQLYLVPEKLDELIRSLSNLVVMYDPAEFSGAEVVNKAVERATR